MGGDHGGKQDKHHHGIEIPDYKIYKVEDAPALVKVQNDLALKGLKDPWLRNYVWRYNQNLSGGKTYFQRWSKLAGRGFFPGLGLFVVGSLVELALKPGKGPDHGHEEDKEPHGNEADKEPEQTPKKKCAADTELYTNLQVQTDTKQSSDFTQLKDDPVSAVNVTDLPKDILKEKTVPVPSSEQHMKSSSDILEKKTVPVSSSGQQTMTKEVSKSKETTLKSTGHVPAHVIQTKQTSKKVSNDNNELDIDRKNSQESGNKELIVKTEKKEGESLIGLTKLSPLAEEREVLPPRPGEKVPDDSYKSLGEDPKHPEYFDPEYFKKRTSPDIPETLEEMREKKKNR